MAQITIYPDRIEIPRDDHRIVALTDKLYRLNPEFSREQHEWAVWQYVADAVDTLVADVERHHAHETIGKAPQPWEMPFQTVHARFSGYAQPGTHARFSRNTSTADDSGANDSSGNDSSGNDSSGNDSAANRSNGYRSNGYRSNGYTSVMPAGGPKELANELATTELANNKLVSDLIERGIDNGEFEVVTIAHLP